MAEKVVSFLPGDATDAQVEEFLRNLYGEKGDVALWDESQHPRDERGRFSDGGGGDGSAGGPSPPLPGGTPPGAGTTTSTHDTPESRAARDQLAKIDRQYARKQAALNRQSAAAAAQVQSSWNASQSAAQAADEADARLQAFAAAHPEASAQYPVMTDRAAAYPEFAAALADLSAAADAQEAAGNANVAARDTMAAITAQADALTAQRLDAQREAVVYQRPDAPQTLVADQVGSPGTMEGVTAFARMISSQQQASLEHVPATIVAQAATDPMAGRSYYQTAAQTVQTTAGASAETIVHELGHHLEAGSTYTQEFRQAFVAGRTQGETPQPLGGNYAPDEATLRDQFVEPYAGKQYPGRSTSEVISMGLQQMYSDPGRFAKEDPDYFDFIHAVLH